MIPKMIHYCWFGSSEPPNHLKKYILTWKRYCPDYELRCWNERNYPLDTHPFVKAAYEAKAYAFVSDYVRLDVLYTYGGIYLDTDVELLRNLDFLLENKCYIGVQQNGFLCNTGLGFGAEKGNPVVQAMREAYDSLPFVPEKLDALACPRLNHGVIKRYGEIHLREISHLDHVTVYPPQYFDPLSTANSENLLCGDTVSIHHYAATWMPKLASMKRRMVMWFGAERYHAVKRFFGRAR